MVFSWKSHPDAIGFFLQYIEDHKGAEGTMHDYGTMLTQANQQFGASAYSGLKRDAVASKLSRIVSQHKSNPKYTIKDLWAQGARVLNLKDLDYNITLDDVDANQAQAQSKTKRSLADFEDAEISPSKRQKVEHQTRSKKRSAASTDGSRNGSDDDEYQPPPKRQKIEVSKDVSKEPASKGQPSMNTGAVASRANHNRKKAKTTKSRIRNGKSSNLSHNSENPILDTEVISPATQPRDSAAERKLSAHTDKSKGAPVVTVEDVSETSEGSAAGEGGAEEGEIQGDDTSRDKTDKTAQLHSFATTLRPDESSDATRKPWHWKFHKRPEQERSGENRSEASLKASQVRPVKQLLQGQSPHERHFNPQTKRVFDNSNGAVPRKAPNHATPYSCDRIGKTMATLSRWIYETVDIELGRRKLDPRKHFKLDVEVFDRCGLDVLNHIFPGIYTIRQLKGRINEAQTHRSITLSAFLASFIGAAVSLNAIERVPHDEINERSIEYDLYQQVLRSLKDEGLRELVHEHHRDDFHETLTNTALRNHIIDHVLPKIDQRASDLADDLRSQIVLAFMPWTDIWHCDTTNLRPFGLFSVGNFEEISPEDYPVTNDPDPGSLRDELWENLKQIFILALTLRAEMEAFGEAIYMFDFPNFNTNWDHRIHYENEDFRADKTKPNKIFLSVLPVIWGAVRPRRDAPYEEFRCITQALVWLQDP